MDLIAFDLDRVKETRALWDTQLNGFETADLVANTYERLFDWVEKHVREPEATLKVSGLLDDDGECKAILELADAERARDPSLKLLNIYVQPHLNVELYDEIDSALAKQIFAVLTAAFGRSIEAAFIDRGVRKLKVFGRTDEIRGIFDGIVAFFDRNEVPNIKTYRQGRWLVFERV